ncbi:hypothetical protein GALMADRAFT_720414 [Galerina marginata CBS 339.88]|uniref:Uncharacterized protein n=1 Tax=Galerina marginata (strain CBS 339.88) TaxID=685588 RepID=A0A067U015_GALM3|nr:hypothetical protein GALMADRAFT_720414 [Galerina marginata CBS 339.88]
MASVHAFPRCCYRALGSQLEDRFAGAWRTTQLWAVSRRPLHWQCERGLRRSEEQEEGGKRKKHCTVQDPAIDQRRERDVNLACTAPPWPQLVDWAPRRPLYSRPRALSCQTVFHSRFPDNWTPRLSFQFTFDLLLMGTHGIFFTCLRRRNRLSFR